ncbi:MAG: hypothetical protein ACSHW7_04840 [Patiriisocius sp.]
MEQAQAVAIKLRDRDSSGNPASAHSKAFAEILKQRSIMPLFYEIC